MTLNADQSWASIIDTLLALSANFFVTSERGLDHPVAALEAPADPAAALILPGAGPTVEKIIVVVAIARP